MAKFKTFMYNATIILPVVSKIIGFVKLLYNLQASNAEVIQAKNDILSGIKLLQEYYADQKRQQDDFRSTL